MTIHYLILEIVKVMIMMIIIMMTIMMLIVVVLVVGKDSIKQMNY